MKYELKNKYSGKAKVGNCVFRNGVFETTDKNKIAFLKNVGHVIKTTEVIDNG